MALTKTIILNNGVELTNAYIKISKIEYDNHSTYSSTAIIHINIFKDKNARDTRKPEVTKCVYKVGGDIFTTYFSLNVLSQDGINIISQAYEYLKTLNYFENAIDIIDDKEV